MNDLGLDLVDACWPWLREPRLLGHKFGVVKGSRSATLLVAHATQHAEADSFLGIVSSSPGAFVAELVASRAAISEAVCCASGSTLSTETELTQHGTGDIRSRLRIERRLLAPAATRGAVAPAEQ